MNIGDITLETLLNDFNLRKSKLNDEHLFSSEDLNYFYMGAFRELKTLLVPVLDIETNDYHYLKMIPFRFIQQRISEMKELNSLEQSVFAAMKFNPRKS